jgi:hypothetical protein
LGALQRDQTAFHHPVQLGKKSRDLFRPIDYFYHYREIAEKTKYSLYAGDSICRTLAAHGELLLQQEESLSINHRRALVGNLCILTIGRRIGLTKNRIQK